MFPIEPYIEFSADEWTAKIKDSDVFREYPQASIDPHYIHQLGERFNFAAIPGLLQEVKRWSKLGTTAGT